MLLEKIRLEAKRRGMTQSKLDEVVCNAIVRYEKEVKKGSTSTDAKQFEFIVRHLINSHGVSESDFRARPQEKVDCIAMVGGKRLNIETKTGQGPIAYIDETESGTDRESYKEEVFANTDFIVYHYNATSISCLDDLLDDSIVITRNEFLNIVCDLPKRKKCFTSATQYGVNNKSLRVRNDEIFRETGIRRAYVDCIMIQIAYMAGMESACKSGEYTSLRTFLSDIGKA